MVLQKINLSVSEISTISIQTVSRMNFITFVKESVSSSIPCERPVPWLAFVVATLMRHGLATGKANHDTARVRHAR